MIFDQVRDYGFIESTYLVGNVLKMIGWFSKDIGGSFHDPIHFFMITITLSKIMIFKDLAVTFIDRRYLLMTTFISIFSPSFFTFVDPFKRSSFCFIKLTFLFSRQPHPLPHQNPLLKPPPHSLTLHNRSTFLYSLTNSLTINKYIYTL